MDTHLGIPLPPMRVKLLKLDKESVTRHNSVIKEKHLAHNLVKGKLTRKIISMFKSTNWLPITQISIVLFQFCGATCHG